MNVLVTGNKGYIGSVLTQILQEKGYHITGIDTNFYPACVGENYEKQITQIRKDIRNIKDDDIEDIDAIIHLAALSNDPLGEFDPRLTYDINLHSTVNLAKLAKKNGVRRFIYSSSQSMYGISKITDELDEDNSEKNPLTVYAKTKWNAECNLKKLGDSNFTVTCFRPSTVFGVSPHLRCDIVFNNLVACAYTTGRIEIKSDGSPWRPVVHVRDVSNAFIAGLEAPADLVANESFNIGIKNGNYTVKDLAEAAQKVVKDSSLVFTGEHGSDSRTYKVSFKKILSVLKEYYKPEWDLIKGGNELVNYFDSIGFNEDMFRGRCCNRLAQLKYLIEQKNLDSNLFWRRQLDGVYA